MTPKSIQLHRDSSQDDTRKRINVRSQINEGIMCTPLPSLKHQKTTNDEMIARGFKNESSTFSHVRHPQSSPIPCPKSNSNDEESEVEAYLKDFYSRSTWQMFYRIRNARMSKRCKKPDM